MEELMTKLKLARIREVYRDWIDKASRQAMLISFVDCLTKKSVLERKIN